MYECIKEDRYASRSTISGIRVRLKTTTVCGERIVLAECFKFKFGSRGIRRAFMSRPVFFGFFVYFSWVFFQHGTARVLPVGALPAGNISRTKTRRGRCAKRTGFPSKRLPRTLTRSYDAVKMKKIPRI